jgi:hypothetical protein
MPANQILLLAVGMFCFGLVLGLLLFPWLFRLR